jgi:macrolide transport system ATP-binding/permease protein
VQFIELRDIYKTYQVGRNSIPVLRGVTLKISQGDFVALMGVSGSGKTTLMNILGCLDRPTSGQYWFDGKDVAGMSADDRAELRNQKIGFVFQTFNLLPRTDALRNIMMPLTYATRQDSGHDLHERASLLLKRVGLGGHLAHDPSQLSGGQQQRVAIARALINNPDLLLADEPTGNLDSKTSEEILQIFRQLNEEDGVTIVLVTHDHNVASHAKRVIDIADGIISSEREEIVEHPSAPAKPHLHIETAATGRSYGSGVAAFCAMARSALIGLRRNILRAALTALGIIIGVAAVITMMEIGRGSSTAIRSTIESMGANNLLILPGTVSSGGVSHGVGTSMTLTPRDNEAIASECPAVRSSAPIVRARTQVIYGNRNWVPSFIYGTTSDFLAVRDWDVEAGEAFTEHDVLNAGKVCLLGRTLVRELFQDETPIGREVRVQNVSFKVIGILAVKGANMFGSDQDDILLAPWTTIKYRVTGATLSNVNQSLSSSAAAADKVNTLNRLYPGDDSILYTQLSALQTADSPLPVRFANVDQILAAARSAGDIPNAVEQINKLLRQRHRIRTGDLDDFSVRDMAEMTTALASSTTIMTKLLLAVALISLVVGGVGIMNIMLVSVTERTREIGLRMAVGAKSGSILRHFLMEAVILCFCGGGIGILAGRGISHLVTMLLRWPTEPSLDAIFIAFAVSAAVGMVFGYYPAWKASRLDPIVALRYE